MEQVTLQQAAAIAANHFLAGRLVEAESVCRQILAVAPDHLDALNILGVIAHKMGHNDAAAQLLARAAAAGPGRADVLNNLGEVYRAMNRGNDALAAYRAAIECNPNLQQAHNNLGVVLALSGRHAEAIESWRRAAALNPRDAAVFNNLGNVFQTQGRIDEAIDAHRKSIELNPSDAWHHGNLLRDLTYSETIAPAQLLAEHRGWWERHGRPHMPAAVQFANPRDPDRTLRVGFLSPDFRRHSVAYFLEPIFAAHDRERFEFVCYAQVPQADEVTGRLRAQSEGWRSTIGASDEAVAAQITEDRIDVLIDLAGHTANSRAGVCAYRPAPVQMNYLGYPFSTGMEVIDYRITDALADPPGESEAFHAERLLRLPRSAWCYRPPAEAPQVEPLPLDRNGFVTFGSFNNLAKLAPGAVRAWSEILRGVAGSRLLMKLAAVGDDSISRRVIELFAAEGIEAGRLTLIDYEESVQAHLARYRDVDIALDTFPYCGTTTTCEALWMGVAVITLAGRIHLGRVGVSLLSNVGLGELIAPDVDAYVRIASELAADVDRLRELRSTMRSKMERSPLRDEGGFTKDFEAVIRGAWRAWCNS
jgi:protein O-GlcNAc transferase